MTDERIKKQYTIFPVSGFNEGFQLVLVETREQMAKEIIKYKKQYGDKINNVSKTAAGAFCPTPRVDQKPFPSTMSCAIFGTMFLATDGLLPEYIAHECLHAALTHERVRLMFSGRYDNMQDEERLAYYLTNCIREVQNVIYESKE